MLQICFICSYWTREDQSAWSIRNRLDTLPLAYPTPRYCIPWLPYPLWIPYPSHIPCLLDIHFLDTPPPDTLPPREEIVSPLMDRMTDTCENITFPQLRWGSVINPFNPCRFRMRWARRCSQRGENWSDTPVSDQHYPDVPVWVWLHGRRIHHLSKRWTLDADADLLVLW